jgi:hypothetical protein
MLSESFAVCFKLRLRFCAISFHAFFRKSNRAADMVNIDIHFEADSILKNGVFVYRLGRGLLKAERRVRFPYALPLSGKLKGNAKCQAV